MGESTSSLGFLNSQLEPLDEAHQLIELRRTKVLKELRANPDRMIEGGRDALVPIVGQENATPPAICLVALAPYEPRLLKLVDEVGDVRAIVERRVHKLLLDPAVALFEPEQNEVLLGREAKVLHVTKQVVAEEPAQALQPVGVGLVKRIRLA